MLDDVLRLGHDTHVVLAQAGVLGDFLNGVLHRADLVDQAEFQRLLAGVNPTAGQLVDRLLEPIAAGGDHVAFEHAVNLVHPALDFGSLVGRERMPARQDVGVGSALVAFEIEAKFVPHRRGVELAADDADRAGDRAGIGVDHV